MKIRTMALAMIAVPLMLITSACNQTQKLATASDAVAHGLSDAQKAVKLAVADGVTSQAEDNLIEPYFAQTATTGLALDTAIRANASATTVATYLDNFLAAFNSLVGQGVGNIKDAKTKLAISTALTGAESSIAIIAASVGTNQTPAAPAN